MAPTHIIPAAGLATRMGGIPKFLLPLPSHVQALSGAQIPRTLLGYHIELALPWVDRVVIASTSENMLALEKYTVPGKVEIMCIRTNSMAETVRRMVSSLRGDVFSLTMPDTFFLNSDFSIKDIFLRDDESLRLGVFDVHKWQIGSVGQVGTTDSCQVVGHQDKVKSSSLPYVWGSLSFHRKAAEMLDDAHDSVGRLIDTMLALNQPIWASKFSGSYIDCGTPTGYEYLLQSKYSPDSSQ